jgi:hypothetical protein
VPERLCCHVLFNAYEPRYVVLVIGNYYMRFCRVESLPRVFGAPVPPYMY